MKIQTTENYLRQIAHALETVILPDLQSAESKAAVAAIQGGLKELLKRQRTTPALLLEVNRSGLEIAAEIAAALGDNDAGEWRAAIAAVAATGAEDFDSLRARHQDINVLLERLAAAAAARRSDAADVALSAQLGLLLRRAADWEYHYLAQQRQPIAFEPFAGGAEASQDLTAAPLLDFLRASPGYRDVAGIAQLTKIPGGMSKHTYAVALEREGGAAQELIVRKSDANALFDWGAFNIANEFHLLRALAAADFPVPEPLLLGQRVAGVDADFFVMQRMRGSVPGSFFGAKAIPESLLLNLADTFARLHTIKLEQFSDYIRAYDAPALFEATTQQAYRLQLERWQRYTEETALLPSCGKVYVLDWLLHNIPANTRPPVLVHGDLNVHNFLAEGDCITAVLDWECALFGDPAQDLAYVKGNIEKHIDWRKFMERYYAAGGPAIDESTFGYYNAFANTRLFIAALRALEFFRTGRRRYPRIMTLDAEFLPQFMLSVLDGTR